MSDSIQKSFRELRVEAICSSSDPDFYLNELSEITQADINAVDYLEKGVFGSIKLAGKGAYKSGEYVAKKVEARKKKKKEREKAKKAAIKARKKLDTELPVKEELIYEQPIIDSMRKIVRDGQYQKVKLGDGKQLSVDLMTAGAIIKVYDALSSTNKIKFAKVLYKNRMGFQKMAGFAIKNVSY